MCQHGYGCSCSGSQSDEIGQMTREQLNNRIATEPSGHHRRLMEDELSRRVSEENQTEAQRHRYIGGITLS